MSEIKLYLGDCLEIMKDIPDNSIDAVITDPPYLSEYIPIYGKMAKELSRLLKRGGTLLAIVPHFALPRVIYDVGQYLKYRWIFSMWQAQGSHPRMAMGIEVMWKPVVWWVKEAYPQGRGFIRDGFENKPVKKKYHEWEQSLTWAEYCLKLTRENDTILDPFMGGGTTAIACKKSNRNYIGIEIEPKYFAIAEKRLQEAQSQIRLPLDEKEIK